MLFTKDAESVLFEGGEDAIEVALLLDNADVNKLMLLIITNDQLQSSRYYSCLELEE